VLVVLISTCVAGACQNNAAAQPTPCSEPEQKQLEFWVGEWDLTWPGNSPSETAHGTNSVQRILEGCIVQENFSSGDAGHLREKGGLRTSYSRPQVSTGRPRSEVRRLTSGLYVP
jgi:hypothetical protein